MIKKITVLAAAAAGYVLGARAGRERYETIRNQATKVWQDPRVQRATADAQDYAAQQVPVVKHKAQEAAGAAADKVTDAAHKISHTTNDTDDLEGVDLVAAASDVPDPRDD